MAGPNAVAPRGPAPTRARPAGAAAQPRLAPATRALERGYPCCWIDREVESGLGIVDDVGAPHDDDGVPGTRQRHLVARQHPSAVTGRVRLEQVFAQVISREPNAHAFDPTGVVQIHP